MLYFVHLLDTSVQCSLLYHCFHCVIPKSITIVAVVGFERSNYTFNESDFFGEICILVTNPPMNEELVFRIALQTSTIDGTARMLQCRL